MLLNFLQLICISLFCPYHYFLVFSRHSRRCLLPSDVMSDPVSTRMGDRLWMGKPSRYVTSQLGRLSLLPSVGRWNEYQLSGWEIINGNGGCRFWQPVQADSQPKSSGLVLGRRLLGAVLHSSNEPGELSKWLCHDDSTINIVVIIIIISIWVHFKTICCYWVTGSMTVCHTNHSKHFLWHFPRVHSENKRHTETRLTS